MSNYLSIDQHKYPNHTDQLEATIANITLSVGPYVPWAFYFCYALPEKTENIWIQHYNEFVNFKDFEYAFMQNLLGNILSFMDVYEKSAQAAELGDYITVVRQFGRAIRRMLIFDSMLDGTLEDDDPDDGEYTGPVDWQA